VLKIPASSPGYDGNCLPRDNGQKQTRMFLGTQRTMPDGIRSICQNCASKEYVALFVP
jgi:hypothetical protein